MQGNYLAPQMQDGHSHDGDGAVHRGTERRGRGALDFTLALGSTDHAWLRPIHCPCRATIPLPQVPRIQHHRQITYNDRTSWKAQFSYLIKIIEAGKSDDEDVEIGVEMEDDGAWDGESDTL